MKLSTKGRYALRAVIDLASMQNGKRVALKDIAMRQNLSVKYLEAIFTRLSKKNILESRRGVEGGFRLPEAPEKISAYKVVEAIEGPIALAPCVQPDYHCPQAQTCVTRGLWRDLNNGIVDRLKRQSLADLAQ